MHTDLTPLIAATTRWLTGAYPSSGGAASQALCEAQARQAVTVAARLRYPTSADAALVAMAGPGGSGRLDTLAGPDGSGDGGRHAWRSWVDEVVASWAACLLASPALAAAAVGALGDEASAYRRLTAPGARDLAAAALLRHPDLVRPVAALHGGGLAGRLGAGPALAC
ncbi:hypothetical protein [Streptomyces genisteinicus]|uniref:Uncharacterized protein n=1 Tax=Streptomyces genisteinicus TaxID=2768068 RepID=A0A7H0HMJ8_9ACTN|nr:hypothetical protein [Streptomyces genisteinicus]QNP61764.1 hypothetical protein IAG43_01700 [Streptomyces genisteinicus]